MWSESVVMHHQSWLFSSAAARDEPRVEAARASGKKGERDRERAANEEDD